VTTQEVGILMERARAALNATRAGFAGIPYAVQFDSGQPGPHVLINALMHGNELCGAVAVHHILQSGLRPRRGRLTLTLGNVGAFLPGEGKPQPARCRDQDMNRVWAPDLLEGPERSRELERARELRPLLQSADFLLDLHSMQSGTVPLILCGSTPRAADFACRLGHPFWVVADRGHAAGRRLIDSGPYAEPDGRAVAVLVECGQHRAPESARTAVETSLRFLALTGCLDGTDLESGLEPGLAARRRPAPVLVEVTDAVTIATDRFRFLHAFRGMDTVARAGTLIACDGDRDILTPYDDCVLVMPSPSLRPGQTAVRLGRIVR
jgi:predicted deacylase